MLYSKKEDNKYDLGIGQEIINLNSMQFLIYFEIKRIYHNNK